MRHKLKAALAGVATLAAGGGTLLGLAGAAFAAPTTPAWEPDPSTAAPYGSVVFYDTSGNVVTGGSNLSHLFDFAATTTPGEAGAIKATLFFAAPNHSLPTSSWTAAQDGLSTAYPSTTAPPPITGPGFANPVVTDGPTGANLTAALGSFVLDSTNGYANIIEVRVKTNKSSAANTGYWESDIAYDPAGAAPATVDGLTVAPGTWQQLFPVVQTTTTAITNVTPPSPQNLPAGQTNGLDVSLTATVTPSETGTVQFFDGTTALGAPVAVSGGTATGTASAPAIGTHSYTAVYTPSGGTEVQGSTSAAVSYQVNPPQTATTTSLAGPATANQFSPETYTATVTPTLSPDGGSVAYTATGTGSTTGTTSLGTAPETAGTSTLNIASLGLAAGTYNVTATFTPTSNTFASSTSAAVPLTVSASPCPGAPDPSGATCTDTQNIQATVNPGSLTITTPYTATSPFVLPDLTLNASATLLQSSATFPKAGDPSIVVHSSLAGNPNWTVSVTDSDLSCSTGSCTTPVAGDFQKINGENLGLTAGATNGAVPSASFPGTVAFTDNPAASGVSPTDPGSLGLKNGPHTFAKSSGGGNGSVGLSGTLSLNAPTATQAGTYTGTITFTVG
jgi:hypothetical protein